MHSDSSSSSNENTDKSEEWLNIYQALEIINRNLKAADRPEIKAPALRAHARNNKVPGAKRVGENISLRHRSWVFKASAIADWLPERVGNPNVGRYTRSNKNPKD